MTFHSILFEGPDDGKTREILEAPAFFHDLNLDQIVDSITADFKDYELAPLYYTRPKDLDAIAYRQEIMRDLDDKVLMQGVMTFSEKMRAMRASLEQAKQVQHYKHAMERKFVSATEIYCEAVESLLKCLWAVDLKSRGLRSFHEYLAEYAVSVSFRNLITEMEKLKSDLSAIRYCLLIKEGSITVRHYDAESDYSAAVEESFEKFRRGAASNYWVEIPKWEGMNHIEAQVQDRVALLYADTFRSLEAYYAEHAVYLDKTISRFDREVQFYVAYLSHVAQFRRAGLRFCYPTLSQTAKEDQLPRNFRSRAGRKTHSRESGRCLQRFSSARTGAHLRRFRPEPGRQDHVCPHVRPVALFGQPGLSSSRHAEARLFLFDRLFCSLRARRGHPKSARQFAG